MLSTNINGSTVFILMNKCGAFCFGGKIMYIAILTHDIEYATRLISYIRYEKKHIPYSFQLFTNIEHFLHNAQKTTCQMVIIDEHLLESYKQSKAAEFQIPLLVVTESNMSLTEEAIYKFRPASIAYSDIQKRLEQRHSTLIPHKGTQLLVMSSFLAGVGKTTNALTLADELVRKGQRVFYFNLERWTSDDLYSGITFEHANEANLSKLFYVLQTNRKQCKEWIEKHTFLLPQHAFYTLYPFIHQDDRLQLQQEDARQLLDALRDCQLFDSIIIDLEAGYDYIQASIISEADVHFICTQASSRMQRKHVQELEHLNKQLDKEVFQKLEHAIYLTQTSSLSNSSASIHPNTIYIPKLDESDQLVQAPIYKAAILQAIKKINRHMELAVCQ